MKLKDNTYFQLFSTFFKIGSFTFGGGWAMISIIQREVVEKHHWIKQEEFLDLLAIAQSMPGILAVNISTVIGDRLKGVKGSLAAALGTILPSFIIILIVARCYDAFKKSVAVQGCMSGLKPAAIGLIASAVVTIGTTVFFPKGYTFDVFTGISFYISLVLFAVMAFLSFKKKLHPILVICISAAVGIIAGYTLNLPV